MNLKLNHEAASGLALMAAAALAIVLANSPLAPYYNMLLSVHGTVMVDGFGIEKTALEWINEFLMAIFFVLVGLEIKREVVSGGLSNRANAILPVSSALGGMIVPALVYLAITFNIPEARRGWAIPAATDIAFSIGVISLLGRRVPQSLKLFLTALAIIDDLGAIIIIAIFYTASLSWLSLAAAGAALVILFLLNLAGVQQLVWYVLIGIALWVFVLKSGVHATLAGVAVALALPSDRETKEYSPAAMVEHTLSPWVAFGILPLFGLANAGLSFSNVSLSSLLDPVPLGIIAGLVFGKQLGVFLAAALAIGAGWAPLPGGASWGKLYGTSVLTGIGFTMSLFIGTLAFGDSPYEAPMRFGVLVGSLLSALLGTILLARSPGRR